jgi:hypothetical protein
VTGLDDALRERRDLVRRLSGAENYFGKALTDASVVIEPREAHIFEGRLAQILKDALMRRLRRKDA